MPCLRPVSSTKPTMRSTAPGGIVLQPEREREIEHRLGVGRAFDEREQRVVDREHAAPASRSGTRGSGRCASTASARGGTGACSSPGSPLPVDARMCARKSGEGFRRRARAGCGRSRPGGCCGRRLGGSSCLVPADPEAVTVRRRRPEPRVEALVDQRAVALERATPPAGSGIPSTRASGTSVGRHWADVRG